MSYGERTEMTLRDYWRVVLRRKWIVLAAVVATVTPAVALSLMQDPVYEASADMLIKPGSTVFGSEQQGSTNPDRLVQNEISVLQSETVYDQVVKDLGPNANPPGASGSWYDDSDLITVSVQSGDPQTAAVVANAYVQAYIEVKREQNVGTLFTAAEQVQAKITELQTQIDALDQQIDISDDDDDTGAESQRRVLVDQQGLFKQTLDQFQVDAALASGNAELTRQAFPPVEPIEPNPVKTAMLAVVIGLLLGLGAAFLIDYLDDSVRSPDDIAKLGSELPVLAVVPIDPPPDNRPIALSRPDDFAVEAYRTLRTNVQFLGLERNVRVLQITSAIAGEGKTTTATNLAVVLAQTGSSVVLVDADLRKPRIHRVFAIDGTLGLTNNLVGESIEMTIQTVGDHLSVVVSGPVPPNPSEMLSGRRMEAFIGELRQRFDYVVVDSAPTLAVSDAVALSRHVDGVLLVAQAGRISLPQIRKSLASLEQVGAPILGVVLNKAKTKDASDEDYGYSYGPAPSDKREPAAAHR